MKVGIMQPYFLPYIGYWQLLNAVDEYVIYDDVNYIKRGWINRNRLLVRGEAQYFRIELFKASQNRKINEISLLPGEKWRDKLCQTIEMAYHKAPHFSVVYPLMQEIVLHEESNLAQFLIHSIRVICGYLGIQTRLIVSSELPQDLTLKNEARILHICELLEANVYYNAIGGQSLYHADVFKEHGIELKFLQAECVSYPQFHNDFVAGLSIVDVMMFCSKEEIQDRLLQYVLI